MGNSNSNVSPLSDARVEKVQKRLHLSNDEVSTLFLRFSKYDREGNGMITREDFFTKFLEEKRTFFGDAIFNLIECENEEVVNFGEFTEAIITFCLFETNDVLKLCFNIFDTEKAGFINKDEIKHFLIMLHDGDVKSNGRKGLEMIDASQRQGTCMKLIIYIVTDIN
jgi:sphingosine kinase/serine/threonine-protein phosphatase 2B regulatory subunit